MAKRKFNNPVLTMSPLHLSVMIVMAALAIVGVATIITHGL
ncbi:MAG TPA: hypothetical protein VLF41_00275 [Candidatus Nanoarchaeia archaeon]|nr:hypothetical protein [Candidatus Nanoarchaeia archaeon]